MARQRGELLIQMRVRNARGSAEALRAAARRVNTAIDEEFQGELQLEAVKAMQEVAPEDTGLLKEIIEAEVSRGRGRTTLRVTSEVKDPATGFAYTGVTRFGHRKSFIYPKHEGRGWRKSGRVSYYDIPPHSPTLAVHAKGRYAEPIYRARVRGYKPAGDWVQAGMPAVNEAADRAAAKIGRKIERSARQRG